MGGDQTSGGAKGRVVNDLAHWLLPQQSEPLEVFRWNSGECEGWVWLKTKPGVVGRITQHNASARFVCPKSVQSLLDQTLTDAPCPMIAFNCHRTKTEPAKSSP